MPSSIEDKKTDAPLVRPDRSGIERIVHPDVPSAGAFQGMDNPGPLPPWSERFRQTSKFAAWAVILIGAFILISWSFDLSLLKNLLPDLNGMKANSALGFVLSGISLLILGEERRTVVRTRIAKALAWGTVLIALATMSQYLFQSDFGIDQLLFKESAPTPYIPGRMAANTALGFFLTGLSLLLLDAEGAWFDVGRFLAVALGSVTLIALLGYAYGVSALYGWPSQTPMAFDSAGIFLLLFVGLLTARPRKGFMADLADAEISGTVTRILGASILVVMLLSGWAVVALQKRFLFDPAFEVAILLAVNMLVSMVLILTASRYLSRSGRDIQASREYAENIVETVRVSLLILDRDLKVVSANRSYYEAFQTAPVRTIGRDLWDLESGFLDPAPLRELVQKALQNNEPFKDYAIERDQPPLGRRSLLLNGKKVFRPGNNTELVLLSIEDVTKQKQSLEDRERFFDASQDLIALMGFDGSVKDANPAWKKNLGWTREEMLSHPFSFFLHPEDQYSTELAFERSKNQPNITFENRYRHKDGSYRWLLWNTVPAPLQGLIYTSARDVTPARAAETKMKAIYAELEKESAQRVTLAGDRERFFDVSQDLIALMSFDGLFKDANPAWEKDLGWTREEMLSHPFAFFLHPEDQASTQQAFEKSKNQANITFENRYRHKDGSYRRLLWNTIPEPTQSLIYTSARDVTPARADEAKMKTLVAELERESAQRLSLAGDRERFFDVSQDLIALMSYDGQFKDANPAWKKNLGWTREEMMSHPFSFFLHPDDQASTQLAFEKSKNQANITFENRYRHKDGTYRWLLWNTIPEPKQSLIYTSARDVTPARAAEARMQTLVGELEKESAQRLSLAGDRERFFDVSQDLIALMSFDGQFKDANPAWEKDLGWSHKEMLSHPFTFFIHPDDLNGTKRAFERSKNQANITFENRYRHKDGSYRWLLWNTVPGPQQDLIYTSARDVTPARAAEAKMQALVAELEKESAQRLSLAGDRERFFDVSQDLIALMSYDGQFKDANPAWGKDLGWTREELMSHPFSFFLHPDDQASTQQAFEKSKNQANITFENRYRHKDGSYRWLLWNTVPVPTQSLIYTSARDVTPARAAEAKLKSLNAELEKESAQRLSLAGDRERFFDVSQDLIALMGFDGSVKDANPAWEKDLGWNREEMLSHPFSFFIHPDDLLSTEQAFEKSKNQANITFENRYRHKDGTYRWLLWNTVPGTQQDLIYTSARDVTPARAAEAKMKSLVFELEKESARRMSYAKELETFSYSVSHDLRAPLRSLDGFSLALLEDAGDKLDESGKDFLRRIRASSQKMAHLIDDMLQLSRITRLELHHQEVDLSQLVEEVTRELGSQPGVHAVDFHFAPGLKAWGDPHLIRILLTNLLGNAWKFTAKIPSPQVEFGKDKAGAYFVRDNGAGFDMAYAAKLFVPFQRLHSEKDFPGTGVGLAICQRIVDKHGGRIWAEGTVGGGAAFFFTLEDIPAEPGTREGS